MIEGGCFCGKVRYVFAPGDYLVVNCHCTMCRKTSAAAFVTWVIMPREKFRFTRGEAAILESSPRGRRHFCRDCGTPLAFESKERTHLMDVTTCSLDRPEEFVPVDGAYKDTKLAWLEQSGVK